MTKVFLDTDWLVALNDRSDLLFDKAVELINHYQQQDLQLFLSTNILLETITLISQRVGKKEGVVLLEELRGGNYVVLHTEEETVLSAEELFKTVRPKNVSYSDCLTVALMREFGIQKIFSFDKHFKKMGFELLTAISSV